jgi:hypothetical protein
MYFVGIPFMGILLVTTLDTHKGCPYRGITEGSWQARRERGVNGWTVVNTQDRSAFHATTAEGNNVSVSPPFYYFSGFLGDVRQRATLTLKPGEPVVLQKSTVLLVPEGKALSTRGYSQRMAAPPGVYDIQLMDTVGHAGLNMVCVTPKMRFTIQR